jgi:N-sulfoglucosamine sulfohydrolase
MLSFCRSKFRRTARPAPSWRGGGTASLGRLAAVLLLSAAAQAAPPLNILLFTADDMHFDSSGVYGGAVPDLTPNIDRLAAQGMRFEQVHTAVAVCQPARQVVHSGMYPHRNGSFGFYPLLPEVVTLNQRLHEAGYRIAVFGKNAHQQPAEKFFADPADDSMSRHPTRLAAAARAFLREARAQGKPAFLNVNAYDPHRPFIGMRGPDDLAGGEPPSRWVKPEEITRLPTFLEDLPDIRRELAGYYTGVRRLDDALGAVLRVLDEEGLRDSTLVVFWGGDHGMSFPFGKSNVYGHSTRTALIVRWPGVVKPGAVDRDHLISTIDFAPTLLEAARLPALPSADGRSFLPVLRGERLAGWDRVYTFYNAAFGNRWYPMRCVRTRESAYIWNAWSDGQRAYQTENMAGLSWKALQSAGESNAVLRARADFYRHRVPEEYYDLTHDPAERNNLLTDPARQTAINAARADLLALLRRTGDPLAEAFAQRHDPARVASALQALAEATNARARAGKAKPKPKPE